MPFKSVALHFYKKLRSWCWGRLYHPITSSSHNQVGLNFHALISQSLSEELRIWCCIVVGGGTSRGDESEQVVLPWLFLWAALSLFLSRFCLLFLLLLLIEQLLHSLLSSFSSSLVFLLLFIAGWSLIPLIHSKSFRSLSSHTSIHTYHLVSLLLFLFNSDYPILLSPTG